ncbi:MAG TPA: acylphosphatase [Chloroflexota bacterium]|jgi:acylphosphatase
MSAQQRVRGHVWVSGRVQMVYYRGTTQRVASDRGLAGWVRNLPDGRVEAVFEGPRAAVEALIAWCHEGPPAARVEHVAIEWEPPQDEPPGFRVR